MIEAHFLTPLINEYAALRRITWTNIKMATAAILLLNRQDSLNVAIAGSENTGAAGYSGNIVHSLISNKSECAV